MNYFIQIKNKIIANTPTPSHITPLAIQSVKMDGMIISTPQQVTIEYKVKSSRHRQSDQKPITVFPVKTVENAVLYQEIENGQLPTGRRPRFFIALPANENIQSVLSEFSASNSRTVSCDELTPNGEAIFEVQASKKHPFLECLLQNYPDTITIISDGGKEITFNWEKEFNTGQNGSVHRYLNTEDPTQKVVLKLKREWDPTFLERNALKRQISKSSMVPLSLNEGYCVKLGDAKHPQAVVAFEIMTHIDGETAKDYATQGHVTASNFSALIEAMKLSLGYLHHPENQGGKDCAHRDVHPGNVKFQFGDGVVRADWVDLDGILPKGTTHPEKVLINIPYAPPEFLVDQQCFDNCIDQSFKKWDIWSLGATGLSMIFKGNSPLNYLFFLQRYGRINNHKHEMLLQRLYTNNWISKNIKPLPEDRRLVSLLLSKHRCFDAMTWMISKAKTNEVRVGLIQQCVDHLGLLI